jgi:hypothetical protein
MISKRNSCLLLILILTNIYSFIHIDYVNEEKNAVQKADQELIDSYGAQLSQYKSKFFVQHQHILDIEDGIRRKDSEIETLTQSLEHEKLLLDSLKDFQVVAVFINILLWPFKI